MNDWSTKSYTNGSGESRKLPATAAVDQLSQSMKQSHTRTMEGSHRASLGGAVKIHIQKRYDTSDLFSALSGSDNNGFPEIKWCAIEESNSSHTNAQRPTSSSQGQLVQQPQAATGRIFGGGFHKTQSWPLR